MLGVPDYLLSYLHTLEKLVDFLVCHFLTKLREDISQFSSANESVAFLVKYLEAANKFL